MLCLVFRPACVGGCRESHPLQPHLLLPCEAKRAVCSAGLHGEASGSGHFLAACREVGLGRAFVRGRAIMAAAFAGCTYSANPLFSFIHNICPLLPACRGACCWWRCRCCSRCCVTLRRPSCRLPWRCCRSPYPGCSPGWQGVSVGRCEKQAARLGLGLRGGLRHGAGGLRKHGHQQHWGSRGSGREKACRWGEVGGSCRWVGVGPPLSITIWPCGARALAV